MNRNKLLDIFAAGVAGTVILAGITVLYLIGIGFVWYVYGQAVPYFWPDGPQHLINPKFLPFFFICILAKWVISFLFPGKSESKK